LALENVTPNRAPPDGNLVRNPDGTRDLGSGGGAKRVLALSDSGNAGGLPADCLGAGSRLQLASGIRLARRRRFDFDTVVELASGNREESTTFLESTQSRYR